MRLPISFYGRVVAGAYTTVVDKNLIDVRKEEPRMVAERNVGPGNILNPKDTVDTIRIQNKILETVGD